MKIKIEPAATDEKLLTRIARAFARQLSHRFGSLEKKPETTLLPLQSHNLEWSEKDKKFLPKIKGERKNEKPGKSKRRQV